MKKIFFTIVVLISTAIITTSFTSKSAPPRLYPELEAFFNSLDTKKFDPSHLQSLENIKYNISISGLDYEDWNLVFYCSENSFRSQASQVFLQTLCYAKKHKKINVYSAGLSSTEVNPKLIAFLTKVGYHAFKSTKDGQTVYEIRFNDKEDPIVLYSKSATDKTLPVKDITSVVVCDIANETECAALKTPCTTFNLPFAKVTAEDSDNKIESVLKSIATEMLYVTKK
jgi:protein-tyrosine-phosphatase